jgi:hypothetical protein
VFDALRIISKSRVAAQLGCGIDHCSKFLPQSVGSHSDDKINAVAAAEHQASIGLGEDVISG